MSRVPCARPDYRYDEAYVCAVCTTRDGEPDTFDSRDEFISHWTEWHW